jgi:2'-5' RNA ligase
VNSQSLYFVGLLPPQNIRDEITLIKEFFLERYGVKHALKSPPHITMIPPFQWQESTEKQLVSGLDKFTQSESSFLITLENFGAFPPRVIYVDIIKNDLLTGLHERLNDYVSQEWSIPSGEKKGHPFNPHVTVAFKDLMKNQFYSAWPDFKERKIRFGFEADGLSLLKHSTKQWEILHFSGFSSS